MASDIPLLITSPSSSSERRITPSWTIAQLKQKLEPITGIPPASQRLVVSHNGSSRGEGIIRADDEEGTTLEGFGLRRGEEISVQDLRPPSARPNLTDPSSVPKYSLPEETYHSLSNSVLAWKRSQKLGRFDPTAPERVEAARQSHEREAQRRRIDVGRRCRLGGHEAERRGTVRYVGDVEEIAASGAGKGGWWVGVELDEPVGKNDGSVGGRRYFEIGGTGKRGVFVRPERVEIGDWGVVEDLEDLEEI
ncbi:MAG: hypothetical protein M1817_004488 [Caeruleum heppii]|nr:MAG: hypothetical protein M1817_004488 [Caeruleum heppii]